MDSNRLFAQQVIKAAQTGDAAEVDRLIKGGADTEAQDEVRFQSLPSGTAGALTAWL